MRQVPRSEDACGDQENPLPSLIHIGESTVFVFCSLQTYFIDIDYDRCTANMSSPLKWSSRLFKIALFLLDYALDDRPKKYEYIYLSTDETDVQI